MIDRAVKSIRATFDASSIAVGQTPRQVVWALNKARLYRYLPPPPPERRRAVPLLLVYALINKPYIFDLLPGRSFVEFMIGQGFDVYLLDWGEPRIEDRQTTFNDYAVECLPRAIRAMQRVSGTDEYTMLGYCIGGTLAVLHAALRPEDPLRALVLLAPPLDFARREDSVFSGWLDEQFFDVDRLVDALGNVPADMIQFGAKMFKPVENYISVYVGLWDRADDPAAVESWQAMHRWVHDGVPFAGAAFRQWVRDYIRGNKLVRGELVARGQTIDLANIRVPLLNVIAEHDHIVPRSFSTSVMDLVASTDKRLEVIPSGHVGLMGGSGALRHVWPTIAGWLAERSGEIADCRL